MVIVEPNDLVSVLKLPIERLTNFNYFGADGQPGLANIICYERDLRKEYKVLMDILSKVVEWRAGLFNRIIRFPYTMKTTILKEVKLN